MHNFTSLPPCRSRAALFFISRMPSPHTLLKTQIFSFPFSLSNPNNSSITTQILTFSKKPISLPLCISSNSSSHYPQNQNQNQNQPVVVVAEDDEDRVVGDCVVFEEDIFEDPYLKEDPLEVKLSKPRRKAQMERIKEQMLVPEKWKEVHAEINITKQERRKLANSIEFGSRLKKKEDIGVPLTETEEYLTYRDYKLAQLNPIVLDKPEYELEEEVKEKKTEVGSSSSSSSSRSSTGRGSSTGRVKPRSPRMEVYHGKTLDDISEFFKSGDYDKKKKKKSEGPPLTLFSQEEKYLLNRRAPNMADATSEKWLPLHTLTASGEFYLADALLKFNIDINAVDKNGLTALHKAIICKKQAVTNYLLRESANPFVRDRDGATMMHYAVRTASLHTVKILLLYNVDINLADEDGWTPLHLAVQSRRSDMVRLLLIKGADKTLKNGDGLTPLDLCLYYGQDTRTYELIKLLKLLPKTKKLKLLP